MSDRIKLCTKCEQSKSLGEFYRHDQMADGLFNQCKECVKARVRQHRMNNLDAIRQYDRLRGRTAKRKLRSREFQRRDRQKNPTRYRGYTLNYRGENPVKYRAHSAINAALKRGTVKKQPCEVCGSEQHIHAHHDDYSKPLEVRWLCVSHHMVLHRKYQA